MKAVIFAGGLGTRMRGLPDEVPKPLVKVGGLPILMHVISIYLRNGVDDFIVLGGYKVERLWEYFSSICQSSGSPIERGSRFENLRVADWPRFSATVLDTGVTTTTGGRLLAAATLLERRFCLTYGDSLVDFDLAAAREVHERSGAMATVTSYRYALPYGSLSISGELVSAFQEKKLEANISAGFFLMEPGAIKFIRKPEDVLESNVLPELASCGLLAVNNASTFWHPMDTPEHRAELELIYRKSAPNVPWLKRR